MMTIRYCLSDAHMVCPCQVGNMIRVIENRGLARVAPCFACCIYLMLYRKDHGAGCAVQFSCRYLSANAGLGRLVRPPQPAAPAKGSPLERSHSASRACRRPLNIAGHTHARHQVRHQGLPMLSALVAGVQHSGMCFVMGVTATDDAARDIG